MLTLSLVYDIVRTVDFAGHSSTQIKTRMLAANISGGIVAASPALYSHGLMTTVDRAVHVYTVILLERQSKHTIQHVCPATSSANTFYMLNVQPRKSPFGWK